WLAGLARVDPDAGRRLAAERQPQRLAVLERQGDLGRGLVETEVGEGGGLGIDLAVDLGCEHGGERLLDARAVAAGDDRGPQLPRVTGARQAHRVVAALELDGGDVGRLGRKDAPLARLGAL